MFMINVGLFLVCWGIGFSAAINFSNWLSKKQFENNMTARALYPDVENVVELREMMDNDLQNQWVKMNAKIRAAAARGQGEIKFWNDDYHWNDMMIRRWRSVGFKVKQKSIDGASFKTLKINWEGKNNGKKNFTEVDSESEEDND